MMLDKVHIFEVPKICIVCVSEDKRATVGKYMYDGLDT